MKKFFRILSLVLALCMAMAACCCAAAEEEPYKIGFTYFSSTDPYGMKMIEAIRACCEAAGCEFLYTDWATMDMDGMVASYQNLIEQGCNGIFVCMMAPAIVNMCERAGVSFVVDHAYMNDENLQNMCFTSPAFAGQIVCDDYQSGIDMMAAFQAAGADKVAYIGPVAGQAQQKDISLKGAQDYLETADGIEMVTVYQGDDYLTTALLQVATAYPDVNGFILPNGQMIPQLYSEGLNDRIKVATVDCDAETAMTMLKDGTMAAYAGAEASAAILYPAFAMLYNHMTGNDLLADKTQMINVPYVMIYSAEELEEYNTYFSGDAPLFTAEEIQSMLVKYNPEANYDTLMEVVNSFTLEGFAARFANR